MLEFSTVLSTLSRYLSSRGFIFSWVLFFLWGTTEGKNKVPCTPDLLLNGHRMVVVLIITVVVVASVQFH